MQSLPQKSRGSGNRGAAWGRWGTGRVRTVLASIALAAAAGCDRSHKESAVSTPDPPTTAAANRLAESSSPYLLQHADNPVDWYPWGEEAFAAARAADKPIFLSIGYSTCHWCHVMAHESFEDPEVARLMNEAFVNIKVDREERPDIDDVYMTVCQMTTGSGGWPLTILMTPDRKPFFAGTYFPRESRLGRIGMVDLVPRIAEMWKHRRDELVDSAERITAALSQAGAAAPGETLDAEVLTRGYRQLADSFDASAGGFGGAPKFPTPTHLTFLLRYGRRTGDAPALAMVEATLRPMRRGGVYDHVGFGFHRYSTDAQWLVPHFEKMLYDQALMTLACVETFGATGRDEYADLAREILTYVLRDMTDDTGGFYSAEDADSEGEEGKFYLWSPEELRDVLGDDEGRLIARVFNVTDEGNFVDPVHGGRTGRSILHRTAPLDELAETLKLPPDALTRRVSAARQKLFDARERRVRPHKDDKVLADWNGLMIAALAKASRALGEPDYAAAAGRAARFVLDHMRDDDGRLLHRYRAGRAGVAGHLDDYAFVVWGLIELYQTDFDPAWLRQALALSDAMVRHFADEEHGGFFFTADDAEALLVRRKDAYDGAVPSGNSVAALNLLRLARLTGRTALESRADRTLRAFAGSIRRTPVAHTQFLAAVDFAVAGGFEVVVAGPADRDDTVAMLAALGREFLPNTVVVFRPTDQEDPEIVALAPYTAAHAPVDGRAAAYVCRDFVCDQPTTDPAEMLRRLKP